jgi:hypothetical protein
MSVSKHVVNFYLMQGPNENIPLSKEYFIQKNRNYAKTTGNGHTQC